LSCSSCLRISLCKDHERRTRAYSAHSLQPSLSEAAWSIVESATSLVSKQFNHLLTAATGSSEAEAVTASTTGISSERDLVNPRSRSVSSSSSSSRTRRKVISSETSNSSLSEAYPQTLPQLGGGRRRQDQSSSSATKASILEVLQEKGTSVTLHRSVGHTEDRMASQVPDGGSEKLQESQEPQQKTAPSPSLDEAEDTLGDLIADVREFRVNTGYLYQDHADAETASTTSSHIQIRRADDIASEAGSTMTQSNAAAFMRALDVRNNANARAAGQHLPHIHVPESENIMDSGPESTPQAGSSSGSKLEGDGKKKPKAKGASKTPSKLSSRGGLASSQSFSRPENPFDVASELALARERGNTSAGLATPTRRRGTSLSQRPEKSPGINVVTGDGLTEEDYYDDELEDEEIYDPEFESDGGQSGPSEMGQRIRILGHDAIQNEVAGELSKQSSKTPDFTYTSRNEGQEERLSAAAALLTPPDRFSLVGRKPGMDLDETTSIAPSESATLRLNYARNSDDSEGKEENSSPSLLAQPPLEPLHEEKVISITTQQTQTAEEFESMFDSLPNEANFQTEDLPNTIIIPLTEPMESAPQLDLQLSVDPNQSKSPSAQPAPLESSASPSMVSHEGESGVGTPRATPLSTVGTPRIMAPPLMTGMYSRGQSSSDVLAPASPSVFADASASTPTNFPPPLIVPPSDPSGYFENVSREEAKRLAGANAADPTPVTLSPMPPPITRSTSDQEPPSPVILRSPGDQKAETAIVSAVQRLATTSTITPAPSQPLATPRLLSSPGIQQHQSSARFDLPDSVSDSSTTLLAASSSSSFYHTHDLPEPDYWGDDGDIITIGDSSTCVERLRYVSNQVIFSNAYLVFYTILIVAQVVLMVFGIKEVNDHNNHPRWALWLDVGVTSAMVVEASLRIIATTGYFRRWFNIIDTVVLIACIIMLILSSVLPASALAGAILGIVRCVLQVSRTILMIRNNFNQQRRIRVARNTTVDFNTIVEEPAEQSRRGSFSQQRILPPRTIRSDKADERATAFMTEDNEEDDDDSSYSLPPQIPGQYAPPAANYHHHHDGESSNVDQDTSIIGSYTGSNTDFHANAHGAAYVAESPSMNRLGSVLRQHQQQFAQKTQSSYFPAAGMGGFASETDNNVNAVIQQARLASANARNR